ncbi:uncharacterized protein LOC103703464 isoform X2 [Phoenix dactylifera]|uniref:Uncharacterized protein LOC103703464 isoform X2 n=1 Tax=Phoenix dactylifera TaxID=42345 RepID=A0A8B9A0K5_PHODC|nr:uncharacterized protein LOC103703464 isoform X2 [Phoenix dactylifera]
MDDRYIDDAELWAVIDSAAASRSRKPLLALKNSNSMSPGPYPTPPKPSRNPRAHLLAVEEVKAPADGEVVQEEHWAHHRPPKMARVVDPGASNDRRMVVVKHPSRMPSPSSGVVKELGPVVESPPPPDRWQSEQTENLNHSLFGKFPSVSSFKQYQNAAMADGGRYHFSSISHLKSKRNPLNLMKIGMFSVQSLLFGHSCKVEGSRMGGVLVNDVRKGSRNQTMIFPAQLKPELKIKLVKTFLVLENTDRV